MKRTRKSIKRQGNWMENLSRETNKLIKDVSWVGIKSTGEVGFVVKEYDNGDRYSVMIVYNPKGDNVADAFRMIEKEDLTEVVDLEMIRMLYGSEEDKG